MGCGHKHDNAILALTCETMQRLGNRTRLAGCVMLLEDMGDDTVAPRISMRGNVTDAALMVRELVELVVEHERPTDCLACMENFDALLRAREALTKVVGSC